MLHFPVFVLEANGKGRDRDPEPVPHVLRAQAVQEVAGGGHVYSKLLPNVQGTQGKL